jgi:putative transposase
VYLKGYATVSELLIGLTKYFIFFNAERAHQSMSYKTPDQAYGTASGGGAKIVDKYSKPEKTA